MNRLIITILVITISSWLYSQELTQTISGRVLDSQTEAPLVGAVITVKKSYPLLGARTDPEGNFRIEKVTVGRRTLEKFLDKGYYAILTASLYESKYKGYDGIERNTAFNGNFIVNALAGKEFMIGKRNFLSLNLKITYAGSLRFIPFDIEQVGLHQFVQNFNWSRA